MTRSGRGCWADQNGRPAPAPEGTGLTDVQATAPPVLSLAGGVLAGSVDVGAIPTKVAVQKNGSTVAAREKIDFNAAAVLGGMATNSIYKTATGELRIVV